MSQAFFADFDLAQLSLYLFWGFFAYLVYYLQRENMREGYPLVDDDGKYAGNQGIFPVPSDKTFRLPHGRGSVSVPSEQNRERPELKTALERTAVANGFPLVPTGDGMKDGVGPASWAARRDVPELNALGHAKIRPMSSLPAFSISSGKDPRGMNVIAGDEVLAGEVTELWIDEGEQLVRYFEYKLSGDLGSGTRLVPIGFARIWAGQVYIRSIYSTHMAAVPQHSGKDTITLLEEEKISAYYGGGMLWADEARHEPVLG